MGKSRKITPIDVTDFKLEQLRFFLARENVTAILAETNPSLAWLPVLAELNLIGAKTQLAPWIVKNFADCDAIQEVAANVHFCGHDTAEILESQLNREEGLHPVFEKCWRLIIRDMRSVRYRTLRDKWFDIAPRIKRGEHSVELIERLADLLRPKLRVGRRLSGNDMECRREPERPTDLISIKYEIEESATDEQVLSAWPKNAPADADDKLLRQLAHSLTAALGDATDAGVESGIGYGSSDFDVPSVAEHEQNTLRSGFFPIVRVTANIWTRLALKNAERARAFVEDWRNSPFRLVRRLALFAAADPVVPADMAVEILRTLPQGELFLTGSAVEVYRLIDARWGDFSRDQQEAIEKRIIAGPPCEWFKRDQEEHIDRCRFDLLGHIERGGNELGAEARKVLDDIRERYPKWRLRRQERAGFPLWVESLSGVIGDPTIFSEVSDAELVPAARKAREEAGLGEGDAWQALCQADASRALRGLEAQAAAGQWPAWAWHAFLWSDPNLLGADGITRVAQLLLGFPEDNFREVAADASWWLKNAAAALDDDLLWALWDRIEDCSSQEPEADPEERTLTDSINHPSGRLIEVLLRQLGKGRDDRELPEPFRTRLNKLISASGSFGVLARVRLAAELSFLFERAPEWTKKEIIPLFDWASPDAPAMWSARKYDSYIGSPELFRCTKQPFLELFGRVELSDEEARIFAEWLTAIMIANQSYQADYPITPVEARSALRVAGVKCLPSVAHRLAVELGKVKPQDKLSFWRDVVGVVFQSVWPLDVELQTSAATPELVRILLASGDAFTEAAEVIIPFIRPEHPRGGTSVYAISEADDVIYSSSPEKVLDLLAAVMGEAANRGVFGLERVLGRVRAESPQLANTRKFQRLLALASDR